MGNESESKEEVVEISESNSLEENMRIGAELLEQESEGEDETISGGEGDGVDGGQGGQDSEEDDLVDEDGLDWSKAPPELKKAHRQALKDAKEDKKRAANAAKTVEQLLGRVKEIQEGKDGDKEDAGDGFDPDNPPDKDLDPDAFEDWEREKDRRERQEDKAERAMQSAEIHMNKTISDIPEDLMTFSRGLLERGIEEQYPNASQEQIDKAVDVMLLESSYAAKQEGKTFADFIKKKAKIFGYTPAEQGGDDEKPAQRKRGSGRPNLDKIIENSKDKKSLGDGENESKTETDIDDLLDMSNEELDEFMTKNKKKFNSIVASHATSG